ncbi:hypothetical protein ACVIM9_008312 [Bradyrhizobium sp. USDA 4520]
MVTAALIVIGALFHNEKVTSLFGVCPHCR